MVDSKTNSPARPVMIDVMIQYNNSGYHRHKLRDISLGGAFVEMGNVRVLRNNTPVKVVFVHHINGENTTHLLNARVREVQPGGARLAFSGLDLPAYNALLQLEIGNATLSLHNLSPTDRRLRHDD